MKKIKTIFLASILSLFTVIPNVQALEDGQKFKDWTGRCFTENNNKVCSIDQRVLDQQQNLILVAQITKVDEIPVPVGRIALPLGVALQYGVALSIDGQELGRVPYEFCLNNSCNATFPITEKLSAKMKKGSQLKVTFMDRNGEVSYPISLSGITKALGAL